MLSIGAKSEIEDLMTPRFLPSGSQQTVQMPTYSQVAAKPSLEQLIEMKVRSKLETVKPDKKFQPKPYDVPLPDTHSEVKTEIRKSNSVIYPIPDPVDGWTDPWGLPEGDQRWGSSRRGS